MIPFLKIREIVQKDIISKYLLGPQDGDNEVIKNDNPLNFYLTGILYPQEVVAAANESQEENLVPEDEEEKRLDDDSKINSKYNKSTGETAESSSDNLLLSSDFKPSAIGLSVIVSLPCDFDINTEIGWYEKTADLSKPAEIQEYLVLNPGKIVDDYPAYISLFTRIPIKKIISVKIDAEGNITGDKIKNRKYLFLKKEDKEWGKIHIIKRKLPNCSNKYIVTVSLTNELQVEKSKQKRSQLCLFQPKIRLETKKGTFLPFEDFTNLTGRSEEFKSLHLQYLKYASFASGHGCAVSWEDSELNDMPLNEWLIPKKFAQTEIIPTYEVAMSDVDFSSSDRFSGVMDILDLKKIIPENYGGIPDKDLPNEFQSFINRYALWIEEETNRIDDYLSKLGVDINHPKFIDLKERAQKNLSSCSDLYKRMNEGVNALRNSNNPNVMKAFRDANLAMYLQRAFGNYVKEKKAGSNETKLYSHIKQGANWVTSYNDETPDITGFVNLCYLVKWRPFQLAFLLSQITGTIDTESIDRNTTDLIWFSTGGGKTEAYLGLIAFTIFYRKLAYPEESGGVTAIMRYTLRLLNKQQFSRAVPLIAACEMIRKNNNNQALIPDYGTEKISIGIWVGSGLMPNTWDGETGFWQNSNILLVNSDRNIRSNLKYAFPLSECPCCGSYLQIDNESRTKGRFGILGNNFVIPGGVKSNHFSGQGRLFCTNSNCHFGLTLNESDFKIGPGESRTQFQARVNELLENQISEIDSNGKGLPVYFVDETIYDKKPTLLFSTVDKYASINWKNRSFNLFNLEDAGLGFGLKYSSRPPELIIQDEMHLITSSLGSIYGVYEIAIDDLCTNKGIRPKIVAATATVRNAENQCKNLYGRPYFMQFPPPGIDADDSFYSQKKPVNYNIDKEEYAAHGRMYLGIMPSGFTNTVTQIRLISILNQLIPKIDGALDKLDYYYNVLAYFNTLKELGKFRTLAQDDIPAYRKTIGSWTKTIFQEYEEDRFVELSSQLNGEQIQNNLEKLEKIKLSELTAGPDEISALRSLAIIRKGDALKDGNLINDFRILIREKLSDDMRLGLYLQLTGIIWSGGSQEDLKDDILNRIKTILLNSQDNIPAQLTGATNMISVGVDIERLNLMQVTGQPKMHAEYIQASSRVGRKYPGLVITTFNSAKNRDRSHYEMFNDYHRAFYKYVESTSVTPFSEPALEKALHAVIYALMRKYYFGFSPYATYNTNPNNADKTACLNTIKNLIIYRISGLDNNVQLNVNLDLIFDRVVTNWDRISAAEIEFPSYNNKKANYWDNKLFLDSKEYLKQVEINNGNDNGESIIKRPVMNSLRNVENNTSIQLKITT